MSPLRQEIEAAIADYSRIFPPPWSLAPNLQLASRALGVINAVEMWDEKWGYQIHDTRWGAEAIDELEDILEQEVSET